MMLICQVCNTEASIGVAASPLGAFSVAYCRTCLVLGCEPLWAIEAVYETCGGREHTRKWVRDAEKVTRMHLERIQMLES